MNDPRPIAGERGAGARVRELGRRAMVRATRVLFGGYVAPLDYPPTADPRPRWGHGRPPHPRLAALIGAHEEAYRATLERVAAHAGDLARLPRDLWDTRWQPNLDAAVLYALVRDARPATYVEVGSGVSTAFADAARRDGGLPTRIVSIDPGPRTGHAGLADEVVARPLELTDLSRFDALREGDVVFMDGSHRAFMSSDATVFLLDVLPRLAPGVLVGIHDVLLPDDYPPQWRHWHYSEQYLLAAYLLGGGRGIEPVFAAHHMSGRADPAVWERIGVAPGEGVAFWLRVSAR